MVDHCATTAARKLFNFRLYECLKFNGLKLLSALDQAEDPEEGTVGFADEEMEEDEDEDEDQARQIARAIEIVDGDQVGARQAVPTRHYLGSLGR